jgi:hypothetical protein
MTGIWYLVSSFIYVCHIMGSVFGPIRFLLPVCRLCWFLCTLNIHFVQIPPSVFGDVSCLQFNYLREETLTPTWDTLTLTPTWEDFVVRFCRTILRVKLSSSPTKLCVRPVPNCRVQLADSQIADIWKIIK